MRRGCCLQTGHSYTCSIWCSGEPRIPYTGIGQISEKEIDFARQLGYKIKLLATVRRHDGCLDLHVHPALVPFEHPLAAVSYEYNALYIRGNAVGEVIFMAKVQAPCPRKCCFGRCNRGCTNN